VTDKLRDVRVTGDDVVREREDKQRRTLHQTVAIRYYRLGSRREDHRRRANWHYDDERGNWVIDSTLPPFE
jgi:hypothetical protein